MKHYLNILIAILLTAFMACTDSPLEDWEPYLPTSQQPVSSFGVDKTTINVDAVFSSETIAITSKDSWTASASESWISLSVTSGSSYQTVTVNIEENTTTTRRTGKITVSNASGKSAVITINQEGKSLTIDTTSLSFEAEGGSKEISITTNGSYTWIKKEIGTWLTITQGKDGLTVTAAKNSNPEQRSDTLNIYMTGLTEGSASYDVIITQFGTGYSFEIDETKFENEKSSEHSVAVNLKTNDSWTAQVSDEWITLSASSGNGNQLVNINLAENNTIDVRKGFVTFEGKNSKITKTVEITQQGKTLSVDPTSVTISNAGGSKTVYVTTDGTYEASSKDSWISVMPVNNEVTITAEANPGTSARTGYVVIELKGLTNGQQLSQTVTVTQSATSYYWSVDPNTINSSSVNETHSFTLTTDDEWTAFSSNDWITLSDISGTGDKMIKVTVADNASKDSRQGTITVKGVNSGNTTKITVNQSGRYLDVTPENLSFDASGGSKTVEVSTDGTFEVKANDNWLTVTTSGKIITVKASANTSTESREGTITVSLTNLNTGSLSRTVKVSQSSVGYSLSIDKHIISESSSATSSNVVITTYDSWTTELSDPSWITLSPSSGSGNSTVKISLSENKTPNSRTGFVTFKGTNSSQSETVNISQAGKYLSVSPSSVNFVAEGGRKDVTINTDASFTFSSSDSWITVTPNGNTISISASKNTGTTARNGTVTISATGLTSGSLSQKVDVYQDGMSYNFSINTNSITATSSSTTSSVILTTNDSWTTSSSDSWLTLTPSSGTGNTTINVNLNENMTPTSRSGSIIIRGTYSGSTATINVTQDGKYLNFSPESLSFDADGGSKTITVSTDGTFSTSKNADWITVTTSGNTITVIVLANTGTSDRSGTVTVSLTGLSSGSLSRNINVKQNAKGEVSFDDYGDLKPLD